VAVTVTGPTSAVVHVTVTVEAGDDESWTEGSLTVQLALTSIDAFAGQGLLPPPNKVEETKVWLLPGATWLTVAVGGATFRPTTVQPDPPHPEAVSDTQKKTPTQDLDTNMANSFVY
jgi:hypothetical protein